MKRIILIAGALLLVGCGPSQQEKERIAEMACAEIMATRNFEEARRIKILNEARLEVGLEPIVSSSLFETNIRFGGRSSCIDYINPPPPPTAKELEQQRIAKEEREKIEEENRIAWEEEERKRAEERKIKEEEEKIAREERERQEAEQIRLAEERRLEEERLKAEKIRLAEEKKRREEEERRRYVEENTVTTHLYCPSTSKKSRRSEEPEWFYGFIINKVDNEYLMSESYTSDQLDGESFKTDKSCEYWLSAEPATHNSRFGNKAIFCEKIVDTAHTFVFTQTIPKLNKNDQNILEFSDQYFIDRTTLISGIYNHNPCEVVTKEEFESKVMIPLKKDFDSVVAPFIQMKEILEQQSKIEKKI